MPRRSEDGRAIKRYAKEPFSLKWARMTAKDIFGLAIRIIGLFFLYQGLGAIPTAVANFCPVFPYFNFRTLLPSAVMVGWPLLVAWYLVRGAPWLMRLAYSGEQKQKLRSSTEPQQPSLLRS